jgi:hypothetical protein
MATAFVPVRLGNILFDQPYKLAAAIQEPTAQALLQKNFPAIGQQTPIESIPEDALKTLELAFAARIKSIGSISQRKLSTINGMKTKSLISEMTKLLALIQSRGIVPGTGSLASKKTLTRSRMDRLKPEDKRKIIFKLLWDLLHNNNESQEVNEAWDKILKYISQKPPYEVILESIGSKTPFPDMNLKGLDAADEKTGFETTIMTTIKSPSDTTSSRNKITNLYYISEIFGIDFNNLDSANRAFIEKMKSVLDVYAEFYLNRTTVITTNSEVINGFYNKDSELITKNEDGLLKLYTIIIEITRGKHQLDLSKISDNTNGGILIKLIGQKNPDIVKIINKYYDYISGRESVITYEGELVTNDSIKRNKAGTRVKNLFTLNLLDKFLVQIINPADVLFTISKDKLYEDLTPENETAIKREVTDFFTGKDIYVYLNRSNVARDNLPQKNWVAKLYNYENNTLTDAITSLGSKSCITSTGNKYINVTFIKPKEIFSSFTLATLQLVLVLQIYKKLNLLTDPRKQIPFKRTKAE